MFSAAVEQRTKQQMNGHDQETVSLTRKTTTTDHRLTHDTVRKRRQNRNKQGRTHKSENKKNNQLSLPH